MRETSYRDAAGRWWAVRLPDGVPESDAPLGLLIGPPSLEALGLPLATEVRLHNELFHRGLLTERDVRRKRLEVQGALQAALRLDAGKIAEIYYATNGAAPAPRGASSPPPQEQALIAVEPTGG